MERDDILCANGIKSSYDIIRAKHGLRQSEIAAGFGADTICEPVKTRQTVYSARPESPFKRCKPTGEKFSNQVVKRGKKFIKPV